MIFRRPRKISGMRHHSGSKRRSQYRVVIHLHALWVYTSIEYSRILSLIIQYLIIHKFSDEIYKKNFSSLTLV